MELLTNPRRDADVLVPEVMLVIHPIDTVRHPSVPPGWRWAVHIGGGPPSDVARVANAGWCPDEASARLEGEQNAATATIAAQIFGVPATYRLLVLAVDPITPGHDRVQTVHDRVQA